uniref:Uncharacterized protein n=1 Tax=Lepeophtheirus salmonis TaxID=72036 RepID=A0A0K2UQS6_LEPSM
MKQHWEFLNPSSLCNSIDFF